MTRTADPIADVPRSSHVPSDLELVECFLANRDQAAFAALYRRHGALILGVCHRALSNREDAEDVLQATFLVLIRDLHRLRNRSSLSSWLYGIAHRLSLRVVRARQTRQEVALSEANIEDHHTFELLSRRHELKTLDDELSALPEKLRQVLVLRYLTEKSTADVANELGLTVGAVDGLMKRAKQRLRQRLLRKGISIGAVFAAIPIARQSAVDAFGSENFNRILERLNTADQAPDVPPVDVTPNRAAELAAKEIATMATTTKSVIASGLLVGGVTIGLVTTGWLAAPSSSNDLNAAGISTLLSADRSVRNLVETGIPMAEATAQASAGVTGPPTEKSSAKDSQEPTRYALLKKWGYQPKSRLEDRIRKELDKTCDVNFNDVPLKDAIDFLEANHSISILLDARSLQEIGVAQDTNVNLISQENDLSNVLDLLLEPLGLDYVIKNNVLMIVSHQDATKTEEIRVYDGSKLKRDVVDGDLVEQLFGNEKSRIILIEGSRYVVRAPRKFHESFVDLLDQLEASETSKSITKK